MLGTSMLVGGCSQKAEIDALKTQMTQAQQSANEAKSIAAANQQTIQQNTASAKSALETASAAKLSSEEANSKIDRMFKRSMYK
jgi:murein lipoprotein